MARAGWSTLELEPPDYAELHLHTCYSFLEGASLPEELANGRRSWAIGRWRSPTTMGCTARWSSPRPARRRACSRSRASSSRSATACRRGARSGPPDAAGRTRAGLRQPVPADHRWPTALAPGTGAPICLADPRPPSLDPADLGSTPTGLIVLSGCRSSEVVAAGRPRRLDDAAEAAAATRRAVRSGQHLRRAAAQPGAGRHAPHGAAGRAGRASWSCDRWPPATCTTTQRERHRLQDAMVAIKHRSTLEASHRLRRPNSEFFLRPPQEMAEPFADVPRPPSQQRAEIAERCAELQPRQPPRPGLRLSRTSPARRASSRPRADDVLATFCWARFDERYPPETTEPEILRESASGSCRTSCSWWQAQARRVLPDLSRPAGAGDGGRARGARRRHRPRRLGPAAGARARLVGQLDHLLPDRPLATSTRSRIDSSSVAS